MIIAYLSVGTDTRHLDVQRTEIERFLTVRKMTADKWVTEVTGEKNKQPGPILEQVLEEVKAGDSLIVTDISRLSRTLYELMEILTVCLEKKVWIYCLQDRFLFDDRINSRTMIETFKLVEEIDHLLVSTRTKDALALMKKSGKRLGRPVGSDSKQSYLDANKEEVVRMLENGLSVAAICEHFRVSKNTYYKFKRNYGL